MSNRHVQQAHRCEAQSMGGLKPSAKDLRLELSYLPTLELSGLRACAKTSGLGPSESSKSLAQS